MWPDYSDVALRMRASLQSPPTRYEAVVPTCQLSPAERWSVEDAELEGFCRWGHRWINVRKKRRKYVSWETIGVRESESSDRDYATVCGKRMVADVSATWLSHGDRPHFQKAEPGMDVTRAAQVERHEARARAFGTDPTLTLKEWDSVVASFFGNCAYCNATRGFIIEHVIPLSRGGTHSVDNVVPACAPCNASKGASELQWWLTRRGVDVDVVLARIADATTRRTDGVNER